MDAEDRYSIPGLGPGTWEVSASYEVFGAETRRATGRIVIPDEATEATLDLDFFSGDLTLSGRIEGAGDDYVWVDLLRPDGGLVVEEVSAPRRTFRIGNLRAGSYRVRISSYEGGSEVLGEREVTLPAEGEVVIRLP